MRSPTSNSNDVTILLGDGTGNFTAPGTSPETVGTNPRSVAVGDFDADGRQDLAVANNGSGNVTILLGGGTGNFTAAGTSPETAGSLPAFVAVDDFDGNGVQDLAVANGGSNNVTVLLEQAQPSISTVATASATVGATISDQATLSGGTSPTGTITFRAYGPNDSNCTGPVAYTSNAVAVSGNGNYNNSPVFTPPTVGTYRWRASYSGDTNNAAVGGACNAANESSVVAQATPSIPTTATANATIGGQISDQAAISGGFNPGGTITFRAYGPGDATCANAPAYTSDPVAVSGSGTYGNSPAFTPPTAGTYRWRAFYSGDTNNAAVAGACNAANESSAVASATPTISTRATASATVGEPISDTATLSNGHNPGGTITFRAYASSDANCSNLPVYTSNAVMVSGNGDYDNSPAFTPAAPGAFRWIASYSGDVNNTTVAGACNDPNETSVVSALAPPITVAGPTGRRAAALKKCKKKKGRARRNCIRRAKKLPL